MNPVFFDWGREGGGEGGGEREGGGEGREEREGRGRKLFTINYE